MAVGAGTVTSTALAELAHSAGAQFIVSPDTDPAVIRRTKELGMCAMPGAMTPSEIKTAYEAGADFVKVFPASVLGPEYIRAIPDPAACRRRRQRGECCSVSAGRLRGRRRGRQACQPGLDRRRTMGQHHTAYPAAR